MYSLVNAKIISGGKILQGKAVIVDGKKITAVVNENELPNNTGRIDLQDCYLAPGFIDLQVNGAGGILIGCNPSTEGLATMEQTLIKEGVTGFLATAPTNEMKIIRRLVDCTREYRPHALGNCLGLHLEGPYINPKYRGAHIPSLIKKADLQETKELVEQAKGEIKLMTLAPELQPDEVLEYLESQNILLSIGHSGASYEEGKRFFKGKKRLVTHLFNAMTPIHHRKPGLIPAAFEEKPFAGIIADGYHVSFPIIRMAKELLGSSLFLVTDAVTPCNTGFYRHVLKDDRYVTIDELGNETLSGSALTPLKAIRNCVESVGITLEEAVSMATLYPAQALGIESHAGAIGKGLDASMVAFDNDYKIRKVFFLGKEILY